MSENYAYAVVPAAETLDEAYGMGYDRYADVRPEEGTDEARSLEHFTESAQYANVIAPKLRALAGYADEGHGTYTTPRQVVIIPEGNGDDLPRTGFNRGAAIVFETVHEAWRNGALDALEGRDRGESAGEASFQ